MRIARRYVELHPVGIEENLPKGANNTPHGGGPESYNAVADVTI